MNKTRQRVLEVLDATLAEPPGSRSAFLDQVCGDDPELRRQVESLLDLEEEADRFLGEPAVPRPGESATFGEGLRVGPYRVLERLGRGGMGTVYKAVRKDDFEKQVALKLLQRNLVSETNVRRFHNERQILARFEHPAIAHLLDGGTTDDGRPYLVMEYVDGVPIDEYCDAHLLSTRARLELFAKVCSALAFAHQSLVVHRDLKPGNILITEDGTPKLLDFGIAKLLDPDDALRRDVTSGLEQPMTPRYASPEQVRRQPITTVSDVYALGALLYRLLTGRLPCGLESCRFGEIRWRIVEREPVKPSVVVGREERVERADGGDLLTPGSVAATRDGDPDRLRRRLAGDVDAIVLKALRKEPQYRYASARELAEDIRRHLAGHPVAARRGTLVYRAGKFLRRHRLGMAVFLAVLLVAAAFLVRERQRLKAEAQRADRVTKVLRGLLNIADPDRREDTIQTLEDTLEQLEVLEADPALRSELLATLGRIHHKLGHLEKSRELLDESLDIWRRERPEDLGGLAVRINNLGALYHAQGRLDAAEELFREVLRMPVPPGEETRTVLYLNNLASLLLDRGAYPEAEELYRRGLGIRERAFGRDDPEVATSLRSLGALLHARGDFAAAEPLLREALEIRLKAFGGEHTQVASVLDLLGQVLHARGDSLAAEGLYQRALEIRRQRLGDDHPSVAASERNLALVLLAEGELATARILVTHAYASVLEARSPGDWRVANVESVLGALLTAEGRFAEAEACAVGGYRALAAIRGEQAVYTRDARRRVAELYEAWGRPEAAAPFRMSIAGEPAAGVPAAPPLP